MPSPNLLFVFPDEFRQQAMAFMKADPVITPNFDSFAKESMVLPNAVSNYPLCSPYRAMLLTGKYPLSNGVITNCNSYGTQFGSFLKEDEVCLSDILHDSGYCAGYIGKWHLDPPDAPPVSRWQDAVWDAYNPPGPRRHGFDFWHAYGCANQHMHPWYYIGDAQEGDKTHFEQWSVEHETDVAIEFLKNARGAQRDPDKPFALFMSMNPPHMPFDQVPRKYVEMYGDKTSDDLLLRPNLDLTDGGAEAANYVKNYFAAVTGIDENFGRLLDCLKQEGLTDDTIVVFTADHGEMMGGHGRLYKNVWYDESFLVPFMIRWPGRIGPGTDGLHMSAPDLMPTLLNMIGLGDRVPAAVEGSDHSGVLLGTSEDRPASALYICPNPENTNAGARGVRTDRYTFVISRLENDSGTMLFDNRDDPYQTRNIADQEPEVVRKLTEELHRWLAKTNDPWDTKSVLFVCTGNAGRSQMAQALFLDSTAGRFQMLSAGVEPWDDLHPMARKLMAEHGFDLAGRHPKHVRGFADEDLDVVITIGDRAEAESPDFRTGVRRVHWAIDDPADADGTADSEAVFRSTCRRIAERLPDLDVLLASLPKRTHNAWVPAISTAIVGSKQFRPAVHMPLLTNAGFRHIELCCYQDIHFPWETPAAVAELKQVAADCGVTIVSLHPPDRGNLASPDQAERDTQTDVLLRFIDLADQLEAGSLSIHVGHGLPEGEERAAALARQDKILDRLEVRATHSPIILCVETLPGRPSDVTNEDIIEVARRRPAAAFGLVLDTGHPNMAGDLAGLAERAGRRLQNLHLHDNDGSGDQHLIPGDGTIDWPAFMAGLHRSGYEGPLTLEVIPTDPEQLEAELARCRRSIDVLRS